VTRTTLPQYRPKGGAPGDEPGEADYPQHSLVATNIFRAIDTRFHYEALDAIPGHILILDARRAGYPIVFANRSTLRDYGYEWSDMVGMPFATLIAPANAAAAMEQLSEAPRVGANGDVRIELSVLKRNGAQFTAGMTVAPLPDAQGDIPYLVCSGRDITSVLEAQRKRQELQEQLYAEMRERERIAIELRLAQKLESVGRLAAGIAHEINTPTQFVGDGVYFLKSAVADLQQLIVVYRDAIDSLAKGSEPAPVLARLKEVEASFNTTFLDVEIPAAFERTREGVERVAAIVRAMKEFAHPDAQEQSSADINHAIETTLLVARNEYKYAARVATELAELPPVVCNVSELNQVFLNLIVNAAHAIEAAGHHADTGIIRISTLAAGRWVRIVFEDNGCGIAPENLERIFDPFFTTKEVGKGTGQGLAIARSIIVEKHGGTIDVESTVRIGTRMTLTLPLRGRFAAAKS
jgi:PAS domain S-box-containing protein